MDPKMCCGICAKELPTTRVHKHKIESDSIGLSYAQIFRPLLDSSVTMVEVDDPYIREKHQIINFLRFVEMLTATKRESLCPNLGTVRLLTTRVEKNEERREQQESAFETMAASVRTIHGINLEVDYSDTLHDREIRLDNGWVVANCRGLDIFKMIGRPQYPFAVGSFEQSLRPCLETTIRIYRNEAEAEAEGTPAATDTADNASATKDSIESSNVCDGPGSQSKSFPPGGILILGGYRRGSRAELWHPELATPSIVTSFGPNAFFKSRVSHAAAALPDGTVVYAGGFSGDDYFDSSDSSETDEWQWRSCGALKLVGQSLEERPCPDDLPGDLYAPTATTIGDSIFVAGGGLQSTGLVRIYRPEAGCWKSGLEAGRWRTSGTAMRAPRHNHAAASDGHALFVFGGNSSADSLNKCERYDPGADAWTDSGLRLPMPTCGLRAVDLPDGRILIAGGQSQSTYSTTILSRVLLYDPRSAPKFSQGPSLCLPRSDFCLVRCGERIFALGGGRIMHAEYDLMISVEELDLRANAWSLYPKRLELTADCAAAVAL